MRPNEFAASQWGQFRAFAFKGNVIDLAVGVIIGAAFGKVVSALVDSVLMPLIAVALPTEQSYVEWALHIGGQAVPYGLFLGEVVNFLVVALALWVFVAKLLKRQAQKAPPPPPGPSREEVLLAEIRDLLRARDTSGPA